MVRLSRLLDGFGCSGWTRTVADERSEFAIEPEFRTRRPKFENRILAPRAGLEPATLRLTAGCSAIELPRNIGRTSRERRTLIVRQKPAFRQPQTLMSVPSDMLTAARKSFRIWRKSMRRHLLVALILMAG